MANILRHDNLSAWKKGTGPSSVFGVLAKNEKLEQEGENNGEKKHFRSVKLIFFGTHTL